MYDDEDGALNLVLCTVTVETMTASVFDATRDVETVLGEVVGLPEIIGPSSSMLLKLY